MSSLLLHVCWLKSFIKIDSMVLGCEPPSYRGLLQSINLCWCWSWGHSSIFPWKRWSLVLSLVRSVGSDPHPGDSCQYTISLVFFKRFSPHFAKYKGYWRKMLHRPSAWPHVGVVPEWGFNEGIQSRFSGSNRSCIIGYDRSTVMTCFTFSA